MNLPPLSVILPTYNRPDVLSKTIRYLNQNLIYSGKVRYLVGNDGDPLDEAWKKSVEDVPAEIIVFDVPTGSLGANLNRLLENSGDLIMQMDDDHWLIRPMVLDRCVEFLYSEPRAGWIKLMGVASHRYIGYLEGMFWRVDWESPEVYIPSNRPHLKRKKFHEKYGYYASDLKLGQTEENFCHRCIDASRLNVEKLYVYVPLDIKTESSWDHVGASWQLKGM